MKNKKILAILFCLAAIIAVTATARYYSSFKHKCPAEKCIVIKASDEAKKFEQKEKLVEQKNSDNFMKMLTTDSAIFHRTGKQTLPKVEMKHTAAVSECKGENVYTILKDGYEKVVIYIHGGAFMFEITPQHLAFCDRLVDTLNAKVIMPLYPLAPQAKWRTTYAMLTEVYKEALKENKPVILMGDSAGAVLSLGLAMQAKQDGLPLPCKIVVMSPAPDLSFSNTKIAEYEPKDVILSCDTLKVCIPFWADKEDFTDYHVSVLYGDMKGLPEILLFFGNYEILYPDNVLLMNKLAAQGNKTTVVLGDGLQHVFPALTAPERDKSLAVIKEFVEGK